MRKMMFGLVVCLVTVAAHATVITVNPSFESPATATILGTTAADLGWVQLPATNVPFSGGVVASGYNGLPTAPDGAQYGWFNVANTSSATTEVISLRMDLGNSVIGTTYSFDFMYAHAGATKNIIAATVYFGSTATMFAQSTSTTAVNEWTLATSAAGAALFPQYVAEYTATTEAPIYVYLRFSNRVAGTNTASIGKSYVDSVNLYAVPEPATMALLGLGGLLLRRKIA